MMKRDEIIKKSEERQQTLSLMRSNVQELQMKRTNEGIRNMIETS